MQGLRDGHGGAHFCLAAASPREGDVVTVLTVDALERVRRAGRLVALDALPERAHMCKVVLRLASGEWEGVRPAVRTSQEPGKCMR